MTQFKTRLIALVSATAIALGAAAPASALDDRDALGLILGAAALGLIITEANKDKRRSAPNVTRYDDGYWYDDDYRQRPSRRHALIPAECAFKVRTHDGPRNVVSARCLNEFGIARRLPRECAFDVRVRGDMRRVFGARCLERNGFRIAYR